MKKSVVLVSGGLDSATVLAIAQNEGYEVYPISFLYSQKHKIELKKASETISLLGIATHKIMEINLGLFGGSALTDNNIEVPKYNSINDITTEVPVTYVPARNIIFLSLASAYAETIGAYDIFIGAHAIDSGNYPDCSREFLENYEKTANIGLGYTSNNKLRVRAPLIEMSKADIIRTGIKLGVDYRATISCYSPLDTGESCGSCLSCTIRKQGFKEVGIEDPAIYI
ncbi:MAG: 7-cyano-7-deazaguanine synthase QueC [Rickettsiaceae bacterium]|nr:7-cyano-7-deazaguanine synthase QueC [Rickettsiaceae bacterium]